MDRASVERLRFDRRLKTRTGWLGQQEEESYLSSLPDVTDKMTTCAEEEDLAEAEAEQAASAPPPTPIEASPAPTVPPAASSPPEPTYNYPPAPAPVAGDFSTPLSPNPGSAGSFGSTGGSSAPGDSNAPGGSGEDTNQN